MFKDKSILVTGGTGSIGSEIIRHLLKEDPFLIKVFSRSEIEQLELRKEIGDNENVKFYLGDVRDRERLREVMRNVNYVFHAGALKHIPACEYNPLEAIKQIF